MPYLQLDAIDFTSSEKWMKVYQHGKSTATGAAAAAAAAATADGMPATRNDVQQFFE